MLKNKFLYLGNYYDLKAVDAIRPTLCFADAFLIDRRYLGNAENEFLRWYKERAKLKISERAEFYSLASGLKYAKLNITEARTRWGSCSSSGSLNFNWRLILAPLKVLDYVVAHEITHLEIRNHSRHFWEKVEALLPGYASYRKWLKQNGHTLYALCTT